MRIGWDSESIVAVEAAKIAEGCGVSAIAVHGRTKEQGYSGLADWDVIEEVAQSVSVPVIGNGDIRRDTDIASRVKNSKVAGFMIGRAAMGYPWIFREIKHFLNTGEICRRRLWKSAGKSFCAMPSFCSIVLLAVTIKTTFVGCVLVSSP